MVHDTSDPLETYHIWIGPFSDSVDRLGFPHVHTKPDYHYTIHLHTHTRPLGTLSVGDESGFALSHGAQTPRALDLNRNPAVDEHQPPPEFVKSFPRDPYLSLQSANAQPSERERIPSQPSLAANEFPYKTEQLNLFTRNYLLSFTTAPSTSTHSREKQPKTRCTSA
jgi:hypothetical protein